MTTRKARRLATLLATAAALTWGCAGDGSTLGPYGTPVDGQNGMDGGSNDNGDTAVTLAQLSREIFTPKCALSGCHAGAFPAEGMSLEADRIAASTIGVASRQVPSLKRIDPGNPDDSYLVRKVRGVGVNTQMPLGRAPLSAAEIQKIVDWVAARAPLE